MSKLVELGRLTRDRTGASSIYTSTYAQMEAEFGNSRIVSTLGLSLFVLGISLGPMFLSPLSEFYGRRPIYLVSWFLYVVFIIPQAVAQNIQTVLVGRFLDGFAGSAFLAVSGGTVSDLFSRQELQAPMLLFSVSPFVGPSMGPLVGGFINYNVDWRWTYYVLLIWGFVFMVCIALLVPETYRKSMTDDIRSKIELTCINRPHHPEEEGTEDPQRNRRREVESPQRKDREVRPHCSRLLPPSPLSTPHLRAHVSQPLPLLGHSVGHPLPLLRRFPPCLQPRPRLQPLANWALVLGHPGGHVAHGLFGSPVAPHPGQPHAPPAGGDGYRGCKRA